MTDDVTSTEPTLRGPTDLAAEALRMVNDDPATACQLARDAGVAARRRGDRAAESMAERALGLAAKEFNDLGAAVVHLRRAVRIAESGDAVVAAAEARMSMALIRATQGHTADALRLGELAGQVLRGLDGARLRMQLSLILQRSGRFTEALEGYRQALAVFRREGDLLWEARLRNNRGVLDVYRGRARAAQVDLARSESIYVELNMALNLADVRWNRGFAAGRAGNVVEALRHYALAEEFYRSHDMPRAVLLQDKCELLMAAGLFDEAFDTAGLAVTELARRRMTADLAEARVMLADAALAVGRPDVTRSNARLAARTFDGQGRPGWAAVARYLIVAAAWSGGRRSRAVLSAAVASADELDAAGWAVAALDARLIAARMALDLGVVDIATAQLNRVSGTRGGQLAQRTRAWHATALLRMARGDSRGARSALRAGMRALERHRATLGATELRVRASEHGTELWLTGLSIAAARGRADEVLAWAERCRAQNMLTRPVRPPADQALASQLDQLRAVVAERESIVAAGRDAGTLIRRQAALERAVTDRARMVSAAHQPVHRTAVTPGAIAAQLGDRAFLSLVEVDGRFMAVVVAGGRATLHRLGAVDAVRRELRALRFDLRRLSAGRRTDVSHHAAAASIAHSARALDTLLMSVVGDRIADRGLVIVPTGALYGLPWSLLPSCAGRPVSVAPSAQSWMRAETAATPAGRDGIVLVAGPGLPDGYAEVQALATHVPGATRLVDSDATVGSVLAALDGARCAHIAAHGRFRRDNAQFSSLTLADGPLMVYDLEAVHTAPSLVVLSACDSGLSSVHGGGELMGLAGALLALGTRAVIATITPVPDTSTKDFVLDLHARLRAEASPSAALAATQAAAALDEAAAAFVCLGAG